jgi:hypothetical protein
MFVCWNPRLVCIAEEPGRRTRIAISDLYAGSLSVPPGLLRLRCLTGKSGIDGVPLIAGAIHVARGLPVHLNTLLRETWQRGSSA